MIRNLLHLCAILLSAILLNATARAEVGGTYRFGPASIVGNLASYPIVLDFRADSGEEVAFFSIDVLPSDAGLTLSATNYSVFSFAPALPSLGDWAMVPATEFGVGETQSAVEYETESALLANGLHPLGILTVDFTGSGLAPGAAGAVSVAGLNSVIGVETPGDPTTFQFFDVDVLDVPEPSGFTLLAVVGVLVIRRFARENRLGFSPVA